MFLVAIFCFFCVELIYGFALQSRYGEPTFRLRGRWHLALRDPQENADLYGRNHIGITEDLHQRRQARLSGWHCTPGGGADTLAEIGQGGNIRGMREMPKSENSFFHGKDTCQSEQTI